MINLSKFVPIHFKLWLSIFAIILIFGSGWYVRGLIADKQITQAIQKTKDEANKQCTEDKKITSEVSRGYQEKIITLSNRVAQLKRLSANTCVSIESGTSGGSNGSAIDGHASPHAVFSGDLIDYASEAEKYRLQLIGLQDFIRKTQ